MPGWKARTMSRLSFEKRVEIIAHLVECTGVRATARLCKVDLKTVLTLLILVGRGCMRLHDRYVRGLAITRVECDEIEVTLHTRDKNLKGHEPPEYGWVWTYTAIATVCKLMIAYRTAAHGRTHEATDAFMWDVRRRLTVIPELVTDGLSLYEAGVARSFGLAVDYAMLVKTPSKKGKKEGIPFVQKRKVVGDPDMDRVSTSYVERVNGTIRDHTRRFARRTRFHSKKLENHEAAFALFAAYYNFGRIHSTLKTTPACAAGIVSEPWSLARLVEEALAAEEAPPIEPEPLRPREGEHKTARELPEGRGWLRVIDGGKTKPGIVKVPGAAPLKREPPVKPAPQRPTKQLDLFPNE